MKKKILTQLPKMKIIVKSTKTISFDDFDEEDEESESDQESHPIP